MANLDGAPIVCLAAISGVSQRLGVRLYQALGDLSVHDLEENRFA